MQRRVGQLGYSMIPNSSTNDHSQNNDSINDVNNNHTNNNNRDHVFQTEMIQMMLNGRYD